METMRYLLADDDADMRVWLRRVLGSEGASVEHARDGADLLDRLANRGPYDLVVTDLCMPAITGLQVLAMARTAGLRTPFLVVTAFADERLRNAVKELDDVFLAEKPLDAEAFFALARRVTGSP